MCRKFAPVGTGLQIILANNHGYPLFVGNDDGRHLAEANGHFSCWIDQLEHAGLGISKPETDFYIRGVWLCPSARWPAPGLHPNEKISYGYNAWGVLASINRTNGFSGSGLLGHYSGNSAGYVPITESEVANPGKMMAIGDSFHGGIVLARENLETMKSYGNTVTRHQSRANVVFCDGHVEPPTLEYMFTETGDDALSRWKRDNLPHREKL